MFRRMCLLSEEGVLKGQYSTYGGTYVNWVRDDSMTGDAFQGSYLDNIVNAGESGKYMREKQEAVEIWREIERIGHSLHFPSEADNEFIAVSTTYGRIKYEILATAWQLMLQSRVAHKNGTALDRDDTAAAIARYDSLWDEWFKLKSEHDCCPTLYKGDVEFFGNPTGINAMIDKLRKQL